MIHFLKITIQEKSPGDYRSFLDWADSDEMMAYQLRGYGDTPSKAADDAWQRFNSEHRDEYIDTSWDWS